MKADLPLQFIIAEGHAKYGPSKMKQVANCPPSVFLGRKLPENPPTVHSKGGKLAHSVAGDFLIAKLEDTPYPYEKFSHKKYTEEMKFHGKNYSEFCYDKIKPFLQYKHVWFVETKVILDKKRDIWGTPDFFFIYRKEGKLYIIVIDYKYGEGVQVESEDNYQLETYVLSIMAEYGHMAPVETATCFIYQPRTDHNPQPIVYQGDYLLTKRLPEIFRIVDLSESWFKRGRIPEEDLREYQKAGDHCQFCKVKSVCAAYHDKHAKGSLELVKKLIKTMGKKKSEYTNIKEAFRIGAITPEELAYFALNKSKVKNIMDSIPRAAIALYSQGVKLPEIKVIETTDRRAWIKDEDRLAEELKKKGIKFPYREVKQFLTIAEVEGLLGEGAVDDLVKKVKTNLKIVPLQHKTEAKRFGLDSHELLKDYFNKADDEDEE